MSISLFFLGIVMLGVAIYFINAARRFHLMSKGPTYSKSVNSSILETGIYVSHGMVLSEDGQNVQSVSKRSREYYESFL